MLGAAALPASSFLACEHCRVRIPARHHLCGIITNAKMTCWQRPVFASPQTINLQMQLREERQAREEDKKKKKKKKKFNITPTPPQ